MRAPGVFRCDACAGSTSLTACTVFQDTHKPLRTWCLAMWFLTTRKNGNRKKSIVVEARHGCLCRKSAGLHSRDRCPRCDNSHRRREQLCRPPGRGLQTSRYGYQRWGRTSSRSHAPHSQRRLAAHAVVARNSARWRSATASRLLSR